MARIEDLMQALEHAGLAPVLQDGETDAPHVAVPFPGSDVEADPVLRINKLESVDGDLELWQMVVVFPSRAVSDAAFELTKAMLNTVNAALVFGKVIAAPEEEMVYFSYYHACDTDTSVTRTAPALVAFLLESLATLSPSICRALETDLSEQEPGIEDLLTELEGAESALNDLLAELDPKQS